MGVKSLWTLLEPVGRRINIEALRNRRMAVDASIWVYQFMQAMRDDRGEMMRNAHLHGFFRRICRLLYHRIRPVFVFDGATPALKRQTTAARRRRREQQQAKLRKTAEKLLLNQLKQHALGKLTGVQAAAAVAGSAPGGSSGATRSRGRGRKRKAAGTAAVEAAGQGATAAEEQAEPSSAVAAAAAAAKSSTSTGQGTAADELLAAQLAALDHEYEDAVAAALAAAQAAEHRQQQPGQQQQQAAALSDEAEVVLLDSEGFEDVDGAGQQQQRDPGRREGKQPMQEEEALRAGAADGEEDEDGSSGDELEMVLPESGEMDPAVLSTLPPSLQLDLLLRMREQKRAANREAFESRAGKPASFSQFQMDQYLAATKFRRQVDEVKDAMNAAAGGTHAARRIAAEAGREYILHREQGGERSQQQASQTSRQGQHGSSQLQAGLAPRQEQQQEAPAPWVPTGPGRMPTPLELILRHQAAAKSAAGKAAAAAAAGSEVEAKPVLAGAAFGEETLEISFNVELLKQEEDDGNAGDDLEWEDVDGAGIQQEQQLQHAGQEQQQQEEALHWRERAAQRHKYWSLSHGFKGGRKLAAWGQGDAGEEEGQQQAAEEEGAQAEEGAHSVAVRLLPRGSSPVKDRPRREVREEEDAELQEAIRLSLLEGQQQQKRAVAQDQLQQQQATAQRPSELQGQQQLGQEIKSQGELQQAIQLSLHADFSSPGAQQQRQQPVPAATAMDLAGRAGGSDSEAEGVMAGPAHLHEHPQAQQLYSQVNAESAELLEQWLGGSSGPSPPLQEHQRQAKPQGLGQQQRVEAVQEDEDLEWEDAEAEPPATALTSFVTPAALQPTAAAGPDPEQEAVPAQVVGEETEPAWEDVPAAAAEVPVCDHAQPVLPAAMEAIQQTASQQPAAAAAAAALAAGIIQDEAAHEAPRQGPPATEPPAAGAGGSGQPAAMGPADLAQRRVRFSSTVDVRQVLAVPLQPAPDSTASLAQTVAETQQQQHQEQRHSARPIASPITSSISPITLQQPASAQAAPAGTAVAVAGLPASPLPLVGGAVQPQQPHQLQQQQQADDILKQAGFSTEELNQIAAFDDDKEWGQPQAQAQAASAAVAGPSQQQQQQQQAEQPAQPAWVPDEDYEAELSKLQKEEDKLRAAARAQRGQSETPTAQMYQECQELLTMFGLPFIIAPTEAEAQCAWLEQAGLVDGVITDDNDVFLFGAQRVYRNIFEGKRYAEEYRASDIQSELGLDRPRLVALAQLLGGDYCEGVPGVGVVNAVEIVHAFKGAGGLRRFREWVEAPDEELLELARGAGQPRQQAKRGKHTAIPPTDLEEEQHRQQQATGKGTSSPGSDQGHGRDAGEGGAAAAAAAAAPGEQAGEEVEEGEARLLREFKRHHRGVRRTWELPASFPSAAVTEAYMHPKVDQSKDKFTFGRPDIELLRSFCESRLGMPGQQAEQLLKPVVEAFDKREAQQTLDQYLAFSQRFAKIKSKRLQRAVAGIAGGAHDEIMLQKGEEAQGRKGGSIGKRKQSASGTRKHKAGSSAADGQQQPQPLDHNQQEQQVGAAEQDPDVSPAGADNKDAAAVPKRRRTQKAQPEGAAGRGRGRGRGARGRGGRAGRGRGRAKDPADEELTASSSSDDEGCTPLITTAARRQLPRRGAQPASYAERGEDAGEEAEGAPA